MKEQISYTTIVLLILLVNAACWVIFLLMIVR